MKQGSFFIISLFCCTTTHAALEPANINPQLTIDFLLNQQEEIEENNDVRFSLDFIMNTQEAEKPIPIEKKPEQDRIKILSSTRMINMQSQTTTLTNTFPQIHGIPNDAFETFVATYNKKEIIELLREFPALAQAIIDKNGNTKLHALLSQYSQKPDIIENFYRAGADLNKQNFKGQTILHLCTIAENYACIKALLTTEKYLIQKDIIDNEGNIPLNYYTLQYFQKKELVALLQPDTFPEQPRQKRKHATPTPQEQPKRRKKTTHLSAHEIPPMITVHQTLMNLCLHLHFHENNEEKHVL